MGMGVINKYEGVVIKYVMCAVVASSTDRFVGGGSFRVGRGEGRKLGLDRTNLDRRRSKRREEKRKEENRT